MVDNSGTPGRWIGDYIAGRNLKALLQTGTFVAQMQDGYNLHWIIIDGYNEAGNLKVRDPWGLSEVYTEGSYGTKYSITVKDFDKLWNGVAVFKYDP